MGVYIRKQVINLDGMISSLFSRFSLSIQLSNFRWGFGAAANSGPNTSKQTISNVSIVRVSNG